NAKVREDNGAGGVQYGPEGRDKDQVIPAGNEKAVRSKEEFPAAPVTTHTAQEAYELVLAQSGASLPRRDPVDERVIESVRTGKTKTKTGIIDTPADVGGYPEYRVDKVPEDSDGDGIPDWWEKKYGLDPNDPSDANKDKNGDGYTNLEKYLSGIDPTKRIDFTKPENNKDLLHRSGAK